MALVEDVLSSGTGVVAVVGVTALAVPAVAPHLSPPLRSVLKAGLNLFLEAESEAEGGIIKGLADAAVHQAMAALSGPGTEAQRRDAARAAMQRYRHRAHARARRYGRDDGDRKARYDRHMRGLHQAVARARQRPGVDRGKLQDLSRMIDDL